MGSFRPAFILNFLRRRMGLVKADTTVAGRDESRAHSAHVQTSHLLAAVL